MAQMRLTLMLPGALTPTALAAELGAALQAPTLGGIVARATPAGEWSASDEDPAPDDHWLAREVFGTHGRAPTAPYAWAALTGRRETSQMIWRADPIHIALGRESLIVQSLHDAPLIEAEADDLLAAANELCANAQCELQRIGSDWFMRTAQPWSLRPPPLTTMAGAPLPLPAANSADALRWSRLHNAIQMRWHAHPVNEARESRGLPIVNGLWLHGGGTWKPLPRMPWPRVHSNRPELREAAHAAGSEAGTDDTAPDGDALLVWDDALRACLNADWPAWLAAMARIDGRLAALPKAEFELVLSGRHRLRQWRARPVDRLKLWRNHSLAEVLAE
jgi:hypothetical protein